MDTVWVFMSATVRRRPRIDKGHLWRWAFGIVMLAAVIFVFTHIEEGRRFAYEAAALEPLWLSLAITLQVGTFVADTELWERVLERGGHRRPFFLLFRFSLAKFFVDQFVPTGGVSGTILVMRSLEKTGVDRGTSVATLVVRMVSYYAAYGISLAAALAWVWGKVPLALPLRLLGVLLSFVFLAFPVVVLVFVRHPDRGLPRLLQRPRFLRRFRPGIRLVAEATPRLSKDIPLLVSSTLLQLSIFLADGLTLWSMVMALGVDAPLPSVFAAFMLGFLAGSIFTVPGGIGTVEAGTVAGLGLMGVPIGVAITATFLYRGFTFWIPLIPGLFAARKESWR